MTRDNAIKAMNQGAIAACISATLTTLIMIFALLSDASGEMRLFNDPIIIVDVVLVLVLAWFIYKRSRLAAVLMFAYFVFANFYHFHVTGKIGGGLMIFVFVFFYGKAVWGSYVYHRIEKAENPNYKPMRKWVVCIVGFAVFLFVGLIGFGAMTMTGVLPSTEVLHVSKIKQRQLEQVMSTGFILENENLLYMYSPDLTTAANHAVVLTDKRLIYYFPNDAKEVEGYSLVIDDIVEVQRVQDGSALENAFYEISTDKPDEWVRFPLSVEMDGDEEFIDALRNLMKVESR